MCGIAGLFWSGDARLGRPADDIVAAMVDAEAHRGPDGKGVVTCERSRVTVTLGHARLAILDLTPRAAQPMRASLAPHCVTFNGEIYNYRELRHTLETAGAPFRSDSDTEVILRGYEAWGSGLFPRLEGMFAFALWDGARRELLLVRDRFGIKPLYYHRSRQGLAFASEVRALLASGLVPRRIDRLALDQYLAYQTVPPPRTLVEDVRLLPPGHALIVSEDGRATEREYWNLLDAARVQTVPRTIEEARAGVRERLDQATRRHLVSDVPVGTFLSGGIDSSAVVALVRETGVTPQTFSVVLPGSALDEARYARAVARMFEATHLELPLHPSVFREEIPQALSAVDHPSGDGLNTYVIAKAVRASGVKVALSGLGGDEIFGGYPSFRRLRRLATYARVWRRSPRVVRSAAAATVRAFGRASVASSKAAAVLESDGSLPRAFPVLRQVFRRDERRRLIGDELVTQTAHLGDPYVELLEDAVARHPRAPLTSLVSYAEARTYMHDVLLRDADQMSMAHGLEIRVPLLDHELAEYVVALPDAFKVISGMTKPLLTASLPTALPAMTTARAKQGFVLPFDAWMRRELKDLCEHHLGRLGAMPPFEATAIGGIWRSFLAADGRTTWSRPWTLVALDAWMERQGLRV